MHDLLLYGHATRSLSGCCRHPAGRNATPPAGPRQQVGWRTPSRHRFMARGPERMEHGNLSTIQQWLRKKAVAEAAHNFLFALFLLSVGAVLLAVTFFFACVFLWVALNVAGSALSELLWNRPLHIPLAAIAATAALFGVFLFIESARVS